jgi:hypothetical protein
MKRLTGLAAVAGFVLTVACAQTDAGITTSVKARLAADEFVQAYQVDVDTSNRVVTLRGDVQTEAQKEHVVLIALETDGVRDVIDQLRVSPTAATSGIDADVEVDVDDLESDLREGAENAGDDASPDGR